MSSNIAFFIKLRFRQYKNITAMDNSELSTKTDLSTTAEDLLEKLASLEISYPTIWEKLNESIYSETDLNLGDAINVLQVLTEIL